MSAPPTAAGLAPPTDGGEDNTLSSATTSLAPPQPTDDTIDANAVTEDEAALYDRQIRLWGLEAQTRMRTSHVLVWGFTGVATEVVKNIVLSGIGTLSIVDAGAVEESDLSAGFFWRVEDVGGSRVAEAPISRIQALNPLVKVRGIDDESALRGTAEEIAAKIGAMGIDVVVACKGSKTELCTLNDALRHLRTKFYATSSFGLGGYIFSDLGEGHEFITERLLPPTSPGQAGEKKRIKNRTSFVTLSSSLETTWIDEPERKMRRSKLSPGLFSVWASWKAAEEEEEEGGGRGKDVDFEDVKRLCEGKGVKVESVFEKQGVEPEEWFRTYTTSLTLPGEFAPSCAILGGLLAQDLLNALGGREEPIVNWLILDALGSGNASVHPVGGGIRSEVGVGA